MFRLSKLAVCVRSKVPVAFYTIYTFSWQKDETVGRCLLYSHCSGHVKDTA